MPRLAALSVLLAYVGCVGSAEQGGTRQALTAETVRVPAGKFVMGSDPGEGTRDERPEHVVWLDAYGIDVHEVTNAEYRACVDAGTCSAPSHTYSAARKEYFEKRDFDDFPVIYVTWRQARDYCAWKGARLPTEAEWEKAARGPAPDERNYPWGDTVPDCEHANFGGAQGCVGDTDTVGSRPLGASPFGALDLAGNVWEWTADWFDSQYYARSPAKNPRGPDHGSHRVIRGGCWLSDPASLRVSCRQAELPSTQAPNVGFRCARER
ncbi:MAG: SUMF1/EgtB/PvdO family nonheme iron enzyme [Deltaproteobacteria bacterium]|nr:SUMF1/EgtB/PvdO family nonheme iron enzyme [Deltaproteobacteria bacterium]